MNGLHYNVSGLLNEQIKTQVKNALNNLEGVHNVNVDLGRSTIEVGCKDNITTEVIENSIEKVGCKIQA
jgi:copper chaperone CopZ